MQTVVATRDDKRLNQFTLAPRFVLESMQSNVSNICISSSAPICFRKSCVNNNNKTLISKRKNSSCEPSTRSTQTLIFKLQKVFFLQKSVVRRGWAKLLRNLIKHSIRALRNLALAPLPKCHRVSAESTEPLSKYREKPLTKFLARQRSQEERWLHRLAG